MKKTGMSILLFLIAQFGFACEVCERNQPKVLRAITHGAGPDSNWDYIIVWGTVAIVLFTLFFTVKWLLRPGERSEGHIKRAIFKQDRL